MRASRAPRTRRRWACSARMFGGRGRTTGWAVVQSGVSHLRGRRVRPGANRAVEKRPGGLEALERVHAAFGRDVHSIKAGRRRPTEQARWIRVVRAGSDLRLRHHRWARGHGRRTGCCRRGDDRLRCGVSGRDGRVRVRPRDRAVGTGVRVAALNGSHAGRNGSRKKWQSCGWIACRVRAESTRRRHAAGWCISFGNSRQAGPGQVLLSALDAARSYLANQRDWT